MESAAILTNRDWLRRKRAVERLDCGGDKRRKDLIGKELLKPEFAYQPRGRGFEILPGAPNNQALAAVQVLFIFAGLMSG